MTSRIKWTDDQWAKHLGVNVKDIEKIRNTVNQHYESTIVKNQQTGMHAVAIYRYDITPSGYKRPILITTSNEEYQNADDAVAYANNQFLPGLELSRFWARVYGIPAKSIQMLYVKER